ncbi:MAG: hypothetical protein FIA94_02845 [Nitrospirae bacterium]|nr:hypothetical protein [Nitrospirota bacterium]
MNVFFPFQRISQMYFSFLATLYFKVRRSCLDLLITIRVVVPTCFLLLALSVGVEIAFIQKAESGTLVLDDGSIENHIFLVEGGQFIWLNRFTPSTFPTYIRKVSTIFGNKVGIHDDFQIAIFEDTDADGDPSNATLVYTENVKPLYNDNQTWNLFTLSNWVLCNGPGDILIGLVNRSGRFGYPDFPATLDQTSSQRRSWIGAYSTHLIPDPPVLPTADLWSIIDKTGFPGNWVIRAVTARSTDTLVDITYPRGHEMFPSGSDITITWLAGATTAKFMLHFSLDDGITWIPITKQFVYGTSYTWRVPTLIQNNNKCKIKITAYGAKGIQMFSDESLPFKIEVVKLLWPAGGNEMRSGNSILAQWATYETKRPVASAKLLWMPNSVWKLVAKVDGNPGSLSFVVPTLVPSPKSVKYKIKLLDEQGNDIGSDTSSAVIYHPFVLRHSD